MEISFKSKIDARCDKKKGRVIGIRRDLYLGDDNYKAENFLEKHGIKEMNQSALDKISEIILEHRRNKECWLFQEKWHQEQISDSIAYAENAYKYVELNINRDFSNLDDWLWVMKKKLK